MAFPGMDRLAHLGNDIAVTLPSGSDPTSPADQRQSPMLRYKMERPAARLIGATLALVVACAVAGCGSDPDEVAEPPGQTSSPPPSEEPSEEALQYVAFGDSWPEGAHCGGCETFAYLWANQIEERTGRTVETTSFMGASEASDAESKTPASLLSSLHGDDATREAVRNADVILIATGPNSLETVFPRIEAQRCGGNDGFDCIRDLGQAWSKDFNAVLDEVQLLREGRPTAIRLVNAANVFAMDPELASVVPKGFASTGGELIFELLTRAQCIAAKSHHADCVDVRPLITGLGGDFNENSDASMKAVAAALMDTGLRELTANKRG